MRRRTTTTSAVLGAASLAIAAVAASLPHSPARASLPVADWLLIVAEAGPEGAAVDLQAFGRGHQEPGERVAVGIGLRQGRSAHVSVAERPISSSRVATSGELFGQQTYLSHPAPVAVQVNERRSLELAPGETGALLVYAAGANLSTWGFYYELKGGSLAGTPRQVAGEGSRAVTVADPQQRGYSAQVGDLVAAGTSGTDRHIGTGIAGGVLPFCQTCTGEWIAADAVTGAFQVVAPAEQSIRSSGDITFAGPAGWWTWEWAGAKALRSTLVAAYAPIGDDWALFRP